MVVIVTPASAEIQRVRVALIVVLSTVLHQIDLIRKLVNLFFFSKTRLKAQRKSEERA